MKLIVYSILLLFAYECAGQADNRRVNSSLRGTVTDVHTKEPLAGATIYIHELKTGAISAKDGTYLIQNLPSGKFLVEVSYLSYSSATETIEINGSVEKDFALDQAVVENQGVTVTGVSAATTIRKAPIPVTIIRRESFLKDASTNLIDALSRTPGVSQISTGPAISKPSIRGLGYNRVVVVNDGVRQEGQQWGDEHGIEIDEYAIAKAEIVKGPASIMYGSDAIAGVIHFLSLAPPPSGIVRGNVLANYQSNNRMRALHADIGGNHEGLIWGVNGTFKAAADYQNKYDGYVLNSRFRETDMSAHIGLNRGWGFTHLLFSRFSQTPGLVEGERDDATGLFLKTVNNNGVEEQVLATKSDSRSTEALFPYQHIRHTKLTLDNNIKVGKDRIVLIAALQRNRREEFGNVMDPEERELIFDLKTFNYTFQYQLAERNNWKTSIGLNGMHQVNTNRGEEQLIPDYRLFDNGAFVYSRKTVDKVTLSGGLRFDSRRLVSKELMDGSEVKFAGFKKNFANFSASAGLSYEPSSIVVLKLNIARGFRAPAIPELASNGAHEGSNRYEFGEVNLRSEKSLQFDAGIDIHIEHISLSASLFYNSVKDFIYYSKLSSVNGGDSLIIDGADQLFAFKFRQGTARLFGAEFNLDIHPHPLDWLHIENTFSYVRGKLKQAEDGSDNLPSIPAARLINELRADILRKGKLVRNVYAKFELDNNFAQNNPFTGFNTETATRGYSLIHFGMGGDITYKDKTLFSVHLSANNITDVAYQSHLSRLKYTAENLVTDRAGIFNMGRNYSVKVNIPF